MYLFGQRNVIFISEKSGKFDKRCLWQPRLSHVWICSFNSFARYVKLTIRGYLYWKGFWDIFCLVPIAISIYTMLYVYLIWVQITKFLLSEKFKYRTNLTGKDLTLLTIIRNPHEDFFALPKIPRVTCLVYMTMTRARDVGRDSLVSRAHSYGDIHIETHTSTDSPAWFRRGSSRKTGMETDLTSSKWLVCIGSADWRPWLKCNRMRSRWSDLKGKLLVSTKNCNENFYK